MLIFGGSVHLDFPFGHSSHSAIADSTDGGNESQFYLRWWLGTWRCGNMGGTEYQLYSINTQVPTLQIWDSRSEKKLTLVAGPPWRAREGCWFCRHTSQKDTDVYRRLGTLWSHHPLHSYLADSKLKAAGRAAAYCFSEVIAPFMESMKNYYPDVYERKEFVKRVRADIANESYHMYTTLLDLFDPNWRLATVSSAANLVEYDGGLGKGWTRVCGDGRRGYILALDDAQAMQ